MEDGSVAEAMYVRTWVASPVPNPLRVGVGFTLATATDRDLPALPALTMAWISVGLRARLYSDGSSIRPWKPLVPSDMPMVSGMVLATRGPAVARDANSAPLRQICMTLPAGLMTAATW